MIQGRTKVVKRPVLSRGWFHDSQSNDTGTFTFDIWPFVLRPLHMPTVLATDHRLVVCYETNEHYEEDIQHRHDVAES